MVLMACTAILFIFFKRQMPSEQDHHVLLAFTHCLSFQLINHFQNRKWPSEIRSAFCCGQKQTDSTVVMVGKPVAVIIIVRISAFNTLSTP